MENLSKIPKMLEFGSEAELRNDMSLRTGLSLSNSSLDSLIDTPNSLEYELAEIFKKQYPLITFLPEGWFQYNGKFWESLPPKDIIVLSARMCIQASKSIKNDLFDLQLTREQCYIGASLWSEDILIPFRQECNKIASFLTKRSSWVQIFEHLRSAENFPIRPRRGLFVCFNDCVLDLGEMRVLKNSPELFTIHRVPCNFSRVKGVSSEIRNWFDHIAQNDDFSYALLNLLCRYCLVNGKVTPLFLLYGPPGGSKSTLAFVGGLLAGEKVGNLTERHAGQKFGLSDLIGKRVTIVADVPASGLHKLIPDLKRITGRDVVKAEEKYLPQVELPTQGAVIITTNDLPDWKSDTAMVRRVAPIYCPRIPVLDPEFKDRLVTSLPEVVYMAICGCILFGEPFSDFGYVKRDVRLLSPMAFFCQEHIIKDSTAHLSLADIRKAYGDKKLKEDEIPIKSLKTLFTNTLSSEFGVEVQEGRTRLGLVFKGIRLRTEIEPKLSLRIAENSKLRKIGHQVRYILKTPNLLSTDAESKIILQSIPDS